ncbi:MAG: SDR family NAD(P)-dependent oxidoreductase [Nanoarchaeota archaeon]|nr:SDR family NAD(P)-dependent oxidoreductase [Nanoarchaeota archaeon]
MFSLKGKNAVVTGSSRGIGKGIAISLAKAGASVVINYRSKKEEADKVVKEIKKLGVKAIAIQGDVSKKQDVVKMFQEIKKEWGKLHILVNNAGVVAFNSIENISEEEWDKIIDVNLKASFYAFKKR